MLISGKDNPRLKELRALLSGRKARDSSGLFAVEGLRGCIDAARDSRELGLPKLRAVYYVPERLEENRGRLDVSVIEQLPEDIRFQLTPQAAERLGQTENSQGVFAVAEQMHHPLEAEFVREGAKYLVLHDLRDPGNLGTMIRTADAVGIRGVVLSGDCVDLYNPKTVRAAMGSMPRVGLFIEKDFSRTARIMAQKGIRTAAAVVSGGTDILSFDFGGGCAVVIGNEARGLDAETVGLCTDRVTISMRGRIDSLNAAAAGTILLWEMTRGQENG